jgi:hypothetical protein
MGCSSLAQPNDLPAHILFADQTRANTPETACQPCNRTMTGCPKVHDALRGQLQGVPVCNTGQMMRASQNNPPTLSSGMMTLPSPCVHTGYVLEICPNLDSRASPIPWSDPNTHALPKSSAIFIGHTYMRNVPRHVPSSRCYCPLCMDLNRTYQGHQARASIF